jgi:hypothetical protein
MDKRLCRSVRRFELDDRCDTAGGRYRHARR